MSSTAEPGDAGPAGGRAATGLVLCGGASRRMGVDKALLGAPGVPLAARVARALAAAGCSPVVLVGGEPAALADVMDGDAADAHLPDVLRGAGPLAAVAGALRDPRVPAGPVVVAACDLPWLGPRSVVDLLDAVDRGAVAAVGRVEGRDQWSLVALGDGGQEDVAAAVAAGERSWHGALRSVAARVRLRHPDELRDVDVPGDLPEWLRVPVVPPPAPGAQ